MCWEAHPSGEQAAFHIFDLVHLALHILYDRSHIMLWFAGLLVVLENLSVLAALEPSMIP